MPPLTLDATQEGRLRRQLDAQYTESRQGQAEWADRHAIRYRRYLADPELRPEGPWPNSVKLFMGDTREVLERLQAEFWQVTYGNPDLIQVEGFGDEDVEHASLVTRFLRWALEEVSGYGRQHNWALMDALLDGAGVHKVYPYRPPWEPPSPDAKRYLSEYIAIDTPDQEYLLVPPDATGLQYPEARYVLNEMYLRWDDVVRMTKQLVAPHWAGGEIKPEFLHPEKKPLTERQQQEREAQGISAEDADEEDGWFHYLECYPRFRPSRNDLEQDVVVGYWPEADERYQISRAIPLVEVFPTQSRPWRPFHPISFWEQPRQWRGLNVPDRLHSPQDVINRLYEDLIRYGQLAMLPFYFYEAMGTGDMPNLWEVQPGTGIPLMSLNSLQFVPTRSMNRHFAELIQMGHLEAERNGTVTSGNQGRSADRPNQPRTATATMAFLQQSQRGWGHLTHQAARQMKQTITVYLELWQARLPRGTWARVRQRDSATPRPQSPFEPPSPRPSLVDRLFSQEPIAGTPTLGFQQLNPEDISGTFDIAIKINPDAAFERQVALALAQTLDPQLASYPIGRRLMWKEVWELHGRRNFDRVWPEEVAIIQTQIVTAQAQLALAAAQAQLQGAVAAGQQGTPPEAMAPAGEPSAEAVLGAGGNGAGVIPEDAGF